MAKETRGDCCRPGCAGTLGWMLLLVGLLYMLADLKYVSVPVGMLELLVTLFGLKLLLKK